MFTGTRSPCAGPWVCFTLTISHTHYHFSCSDREEGEWVYKNSLWEPDPVPRDDKTIKVEDVARFLVLFSAFTRPDSVLGKRETDTERILVVVKGFGNSFKG